MGGANPRFGRQETTNQIRRITISVGMRTPVLNRIHPRIESVHDHVAQPEQAIGDVAPPADAGP